MDAEAATAYGAAYPMGARMMSGHTSLHEQLQEELATFVNKSRLSVKFWISGDSFYHRHFGVEK